MRIHGLPTVLLFVVLAGCGSGDGEGGGNAGSAIDLGTATLPELSLSARRLDPVTAGGTCRIELRVVSDTGSPAVTAVGVRAGTAFEPGASVITMIQTSTDPTLYHATVAVPAPIAVGLRIVVIAIRADGSTSETGIDDFQVR